VSSGVGIDFAFFTGDVVAKGDFSLPNTDLARAAFFEPLLSASGLSPHNLFVTPGNHDVQLKERSPLLEPNYDSIKSEDDVHKFFVNFARTPLPTGLEAFYRLIDSIGQEPPLLQTPFYRAYVRDLRGVKIGICLINTAWKASGAANDVDYGRLVIGRHQLDELSQATKDSDINFGLLHHPVNWLSAFDYNVSQRLLYTHFDGIFYGHNHDADATSVAGSFGSYFASNAGCLYQSREYFNGYSVLTLDLDTKKWTVAAREYFEARQRFDMSSRFAPGGTQVYATSPRDGGADLYIPSSEFIAAVNEKASQQLLSSAVSDVAPRSIHDLFVDPPLSYMSERQLTAEMKAAEAPLYLSLKDVIALKKPVYFVGPKESGKTILLHRLCCQIGELGVLNFPPFSAYIDLQNSLDTRSKLLDAIVRFSDGAYRRAEFLEFMRRGLVAICVDNLERANAREIKVLSELTREFPECRYFFACREEMETSLSASSVPDLGLETEVLYIHSFGRKETRALASRWFGAVDPNTAEKVDDILRSLRRLNVPRTPFLISAMLWIKEREFNFSPVNQSAIIDALIDGVLEKLTESKERSSLDSTNKRHFLAAFAEQLYRLELSRLPAADLDRFSVAYFASKGLNQPVGPFLEELETRGFLIDVGGHVGFKFDCMRAFFLASRLRESNELLGAALSEEGFTQFGEELDYLSGATRDRVDVLVKSIEILESHHREAELDLDLAYFDEVSLQNSPFDKGRQAELTDKVFSSRLVGERRQEELDRIDGQARGTPAKALDKADLAKLEAFPRFVAALQIASTVLRNSELIDDVGLKERAYRLVTGYWCEILIAVLATVEDLEENPHAFDALANLLPQNNRGLAAYLLKVIAPNVIFNVVLEKLGTAKLQLVIERAIAEDFSGDGDTARRVMDTFLYADLDLSKRFQYIGQLLEKNGNNRFVAELIFFKLAQIVLVKELSVSQETEVRRLLGKSLGGVFSAKPRAARDRLKSRILASLNRKKVVDGGAAQAATVPASNKGAEPSDKR